ncbi:hypothetical protein [Zavarzinia sp.]|uniref:hypothetical protein n=1 Tax=Zavarzinia sp. TaxID=2027920 RepID=UPI0035692F7D
MAEIRGATAIANNEVAFIAWRLEPLPLPGCLGFCLVREYLNDDDSVRERRPLASYIPFKGQRNSKWQAQNTTVWPVQKFTWRDLTLRKKRDGSGRRVPNERVRYEIRAVGDLRPGLEEVVAVPESHVVRGTTRHVLHTYEGTPRRLCYLTPPAWTNVVDVTASRPPFVSTFTNAILSTQFLRNVLNEDGVVQPDELKLHLSTKGDWLREYLAGDVIHLMRDFFERNPGGRFKAALYELEDDELVELLATHAERIDLILSDAGTADQKDANGNPILNAQGKKVTRYDARNERARATLRALADRPGTAFRLHNRMFNGAGHIGHNKFVAYMPDGVHGAKVLSGSANWTWTGVAGQSNNEVVIEDVTIAGAFVDYWDRLLTDTLPVPVPLSARATGAKQGKLLQQANRTPVPPGEAALQVWFSPNMPGKQQPTNSKSGPPETPPDMARLFSLMRQAQRAIFFLVFYPAQGGTNSIVSEAVNLGLNDPSLMVLGAVSAAAAMWGYETAADTGTGKNWAPHVFQRAGVSVVRATALTDSNLIGGLGDFKLDEQLTANGTVGAIIHDKILVIDPQDAERSVVAFGSHNMGFKASYSNDENLIIVRGNQALAQAYATHVLDVYDHYRFRAAEAEIAAKKSGKENGTAMAQVGWDGFLDTTDRWQQKVSTRLAAYFTE